MNPKMAAVSVTSCQLGGDGVIIKQESVMDKPYSLNIPFPGSSSSISSSPSQATREAAEALLLMGERGGMNRRSVITENNNRPIKNNDLLGTNASSSSGSWNASDGINIIRNASVNTQFYSNQSPQSSVLPFSLRAGSEPSAFVSVPMSSNGGGGELIRYNAAVTAPNNGINVAFVNSYSHPISQRPHVFSQGLEVPVSVVRKVNRKEIVMEQGINSMSPLSPFHFQPRMNPPMGVSPKFPTFPLGVVARNEKEFCSAEPIIESPGGRPKQRAGSTTENSKNVSTNSTNRNSFSNTDMHQHSVNLRDFQTIRNMNADTPIKIDIGGNHLNQQKSPNDGRLTQTWILSNHSSGHEPIQIISPSKINSPKANIIGTGILPRTAFIFTPQPAQSPSNGSNINNNNTINDFGNSDIENAEQQRIKKNKLMKKTLRAKVPMSLDASKPIKIDSYEIQREYWAKAFVQADICHAAGILFKALFTPEEIQNCTLRGRNGTYLLDLEKRSAIFRAVGWMKNKNQDPYSFDSLKLGNEELLTQEERAIIEKKVFVERRYQTSRKIRDVPLPRKQINSNNSKEQIQNNQNQSLHFHHNNLLLEKLCDEPNRSQQLVEQVIVKAEPADVLGNDSNIFESDGSAPYIKREREDEPMDMEEEAHNVHDVTAPSNSDLDPPSPKQMKLMSY